MINENYLPSLLHNLQAALGLDYHASGSRKRTVLFCMDNGLPALTDRLRLVQETDAVAYGVVLMHPGIQLSTSASHGESNYDQWPRDLASIVVRIPALLERSAVDQGESSVIYLYDKSDSSRGDNAPPLFLGAMEVSKRKGGTGKATLTDLPEMELAELTGTSEHYYTEDIPAANKIWTVVIMSADGTFEPNFLFEILGGTLIGVASICLAVWIWHNNRRIIRYNRLRAAVNAEKASLILENAKETAKAERELNDFIAHEGRFILSVGCSHALIRVLRN